MGKARGDFSEVLIKKGIIGPDQIAEAKGLQQQTGLKLQDALVKLGYCTMEEVMKAIAEHSGMESVDLTDATIPPSVVELVPESVARENVVLPLSLEGNVLKIITADPSNYDTIQKLQFILNKDVQPVLAVQEQIQEAINRNYGQTETESVDSMLVEFTDTAIEFTQTESVMNMASAEESDAPVVRLCNLIIQEAINLRASDIHIEPFGDRVRVRYRIDGILVERDSAPRRLHRHSHPPQTHRPRPASRSRSAGEQPGRQDPRLARSSELRFAHRVYDGDRRTPRHAVRGPDRDGNPQVRDRTRAGVGRPRKRRPPALA